MPRTALIVTREVWRGVDPGSSAVWDRLRVRGLSQYFGQSVLERLA